MSSEALPKLNIDAISEHLFETVLNSCILEQCFYLHRERTFLKTGRGKGSLSPEPPAIRDPAVMAQQQAQATRAKNLDCKCTICYRSFAAARFAPHLEKCFGMGRRAARRQAQNYNDKADSRSDSVHSLSEDTFATRSDSDEEDWGPKKKKRKPAKKRK